MVHGLVGRGGRQVHGGELLGGQPHRGLHPLFYLARGLAAVKDGPGDQRIRGEVGGGQPGPHQLQFTLQALPPP